MQCGAGEVNRFYRRPWLCLCLRTLILLGAACALFVGVVALVLAPGAEPPVAAQGVESEPAVVELSLGA